ncbi:MAG: ATP-binding protein [Bacteroidales bacterium]|nr:ATP-binding protein [Bacteroidales bacterium]
MKRKKEEYLSEWLRKKSRKPLILRGARQVGKSTLVRQFADNEGLILHEINLERHRRLDEVFAKLDMERIFSEIQYICKKGSVLQEKSLIFLDEIQATPHALESLRYFFEDYPHIPVIAAGSLLEFTLSKHNFSMPVGRVEYLYLSPVSFEEFLLASNETALLDLLENYKYPDHFPYSAHSQLLELLRKYLLTGGMPEAVKRFIESNDIHEAMNVHSSILETYQNDFSKYCTDRQLSVVQNVFDRIPLLVGNKMKYTNLDRDILSRDLKAAVELLAKAGVISQVTHTSANGIPLKAEEDHSVYKPYFLDCGLMNRSCRVEWISPEELTDVKFINEGNLAEQFICQHLLLLERENEQPRLNYWLREKKSTNSEVDFLMQINREIIPIEVKSGKSGSLRSLHYFTYEKHNYRALRFDLNPPSVQEISHKVRTATGEYSNVSYTLYSLPLYLAEESRRLLMSLIA